MNKLIVLFCAIALSLTSFGAAGAAVIQVDPLLGDQTLGAIFDLTIQGATFDGLNPTTGAAENATGSHGGGLNISWDASVLSLNTSGVSLDPRWNFIRNTGTLVTNDGTGIDKINGLAVGFADFFGGTLPDPAFDIATLNFTAIGVGDALFTMELVGSNPWVDSASIALLSQPLTEGSVNVVPIPGSLLLLGTGLVGLVGIGRKKRS